MHLFWIISGLLVAVTLAVLLGTSRRPDPNRDETLSTRELHGSRVRELGRDLEDETISAQDASIAQDEIDRALLEETSGSNIGDKPTINAPTWLTAVVVAVCVPLMTFTTYFQLGQPNVATGTKSVTAEHVEPNAENIDAMLASLEQRLVDDPDSAEGWLLLGRSYLAVGRYADAASALGKTHELVGDVPRVLLLYADALAMANGGGFTEKVRDLIARCLELEPDNVTALWLSGLAAVEIGERDQALDYLTRARSLHAQSGAPTDELDKAIIELGGELTELQNPSTPASAINVTVRLDPALSSKIVPTDTLFVFARTPGSGGPPLAVSRTGAGALPYTVVLDESMAMAPMFKLQPGQTVAVTARISKSGTPTAVTGDLQGVSPPVVVGKSGLIEIVISEIVE